MSGDDSIWIQAMGGVRYRDQSMALGQPFGGIYPIVWTPGRTGGIWHLFGHRIEGKLNQPQVAQILQHIGE